MCLIPKQTTQHNSPIIVRNRSNRSNTNYKVPTRIQLDRTLSISIDGIEIQLLSNNMISSSSDLIWVTMGAAATSTQQHPAKPLTEIPNNFGKILVRWEINGKKEWVDAHKVNTKGLQPRKRKRPQVYTGIKTENGEENNCGGVGSGYGTARAKQVNRSKEVNRACTPKAQQQQQRIITQTASTEVLIEPKVGDRFRARYKVRDHINTTNFCYTWFFGTATHVAEISCGSNATTSMAYMLTLRYDSMVSEDEEYPNENVQMILPCSHHLHDDDDDDDRLGQANDLVYAMNHVTGKREIAYHSNPKNLVVGDLVQCHYQNGMYNNAWYVGRVAEVHKNGERIDVNYIDGDFECNIPLSKGKVILIERGSNSDSWLLGNSVEWKTTKYKRGGASSRGPQSSNIQKGTIIDVVGRDTSIKDTSFQSPFVDYSHLAFCTVKLSTGKEASISYADVVKRIFASRKSICDATLAVKYWPGTEGINKKRTKAKMVRRLRTSSLKDISNLDIRASIENAPIDQVKKRQVKVSTLKRNRFDSKNLQISNQVPHINELSNQKDTDLHYVSNVSKLESDGVGIYKKKAREMEPLIANTMLRALESAESHAGCNLLTQMACILNTVPNSKLAQNLFEFTATGPKSEGTHFRDPNKTELISNYVRTVIEKSYEPNCISAPKIAPMNWDEIEQILSLPISQTDDSIVPCNLYDSWSRVMIHQLGLALQMSSNSLSSLSKIFTNELSHLSASRKMGTQAQPLSSAIIKYGIRKSLKTSVSISLRSWIRHGHWLYGFMNEHRRVCKSSDEQRCATEAKCCLNYLGKIISFLARLYCTEENIQFAHVNCCYVIVEAIESEFERADYKSLQKANPSMKEKYIARIKLRFLLSLDTEFSRPLQMNMGNMLEISNDLSFVIG